MFNVKWGYPIKRPYISLTSAPKGLGCENNLYEVKACFKVKWGHHTKTS